MPELSQIAQYQIVEALPPSGKVRAYRATDQRTGQTVTLKTTSKDARDPEVAGLIARLRSESQVGAKLKHSGIVEVYEYGEDSQIAYLATEFLEGCALQSRLRVPIADAGSLIIQLLNALEYAHQQRVLHLNLIPAALVLTSKGHLKVQGFGGPQAGSDDSAYRSPEQLEGGAIAPSADVFSAGALFYEWLAGAPAFPGPADQLRNQIVSTQETRVSHVKPSVPAVFDEVCGRALAKNSKFRYPHVRAFRDEVYGAYEEAFGKSPQELVSNETAVSAFLSSLRTESRKNRPAPSPPKPQPAPPPPMGPSLFPMETLRIVERDLALFLGPLARIVVKEAASKAENLNELYHLSAENLATPDDRAGFLARSPGGRPIYQEAQDVTNDATATSLDISSDSLLSAMATPPPEPIVKATEIKLPSQPQEPVVSQSPRNAETPVAQRKQAVEPQRPGPPAEAPKEVEPPQKAELDPKIVERLEDLLGKQPETLAAYLSENPPELEYVIHPFKSSAEALMRLYEAKGKTNGLIPQNIVFDRMGVASIQMPVDPAAGGTTLGAMGSPRYTAPEILADKGADASPTAADIYSLGFIFYEILLGRRQFRAIFRQETDLDWLRWHSDRTKVAPSLRSQFPDHPAVLSDLLQSMMEKDPAKRAKDPAAVVSRLRSIAQQASPTLVRRHTETVVSKPKTTATGAVSEPVRQAAKKRSGNMTLVMIIVAVVLLLGMLALLFFLSGKPLSQNKRWSHPVCVSVAGSNLSISCKRFNLNNKLPC
ncbi:MAG TPA: protein kinase [Candidatus Sulfotelmatobacter sp.]|jgi:serine/threonine-protein kinase|nr:protein kinase [Candidatus Sulfotelmatobacter sp.]